MINLSDFIQQLGYILITVVLSPIFIFIGFFSMIGTAWFIGIIITAIKGISEKKL